MARRAAGRRSRASTCRPTTSRCSSTRRARPGSRRARCCRARTLFALVPGANERARTRRRHASAWSRCRCSTSPARAGRSSASSNGAHNVLLRDVDLAAILDDDPAVRRDRTRCSCPRCCSSCSRRPGVEDTDFSSLRHDPLRRVADLRGRARRGRSSAFGCRFVQAYGLTETDGAVVAAPARGPRPGGPERAPAARRRARRCPASSCASSTPTATTSPIGEVGEVWIRSPSNMVGYWNMPEATAAAITPDGWFQSGDAGYLDADGYLYIARPREGHDHLGRREHLPGRGRERADGAPRRRRRRGDRRARRAVGRGGQGDRRARARTPTATRRTSVIACCRERLAHYKCPTSVDWTDALPAQPVGQDPQARAPRAVLGRPRPPGQLARTRARERRGPLLDERRDTLLRVRRSAGSHERRSFVLELVRERRGRVRHGAGASPRRTPGSGPPPSCGDELPRPRTARRRRGRHGARAPTPSPRPRSARGS